MSLCSSLKWLYSGELKTELESEAEIKLSNYNNSVKSNLESFKRVFISIRQSLHVLDVVFIFSGQTLLSFYYTS